MQRGLSISWLRGGAAIVVVALPASCGPGLRDREINLSVSRTLGQPGGDIAIGEATLHVWEDCLAAPAQIASRRFSAVEHLGAVGSVFEIAIPMPDRFKNDPRMVIATSSEVAANPSSVIGFLVPGAANERWVPDSPPPNFAACEPPLVCGPVQVWGFTNPGGVKAPSLTTKRLQFAIVTKRDSIEECPVGQSCNSAACNSCPTGSLCN